ncbi:Ribonuclease E (chloroplast) [Gracilaria domingensis]|uniref:ribonuclease E n=1 Tax=Gracilaria domingensis TaxID=172961 RepID=UPI001D1021DF|nr:ribonuclease E [Gracilaria domingensis]KAI0556389.1 Ribonuclease E [Gracilaria domingensis]UAD85301.1 ribonuclease E [Gracilaria domingensis]
MIKKIVISQYKNLAAILNNNKIQEIVTINNLYQVNDIYIGTVEKIFSSINAAFIKLNKSGKSGFIHINDIKHIKKGKHIKNIEEILSINQVILVQIIKEPTIYKGPRLTANIHLHGKYLVLMPFCNTICISHKIYDYNERTHLYSLAVLLKPSKMGLLIKSSAEGIQENIILDDLDDLKKQWNFIEKAIISNSSPLLLYKDENLIKKIIRDFYENNITKVIIDSKEGLNQLNYYLYKWNCLSPRHNTKLQLYNQSKCILDQFYIKHAIDNALKPKVKLPYGGHIIIESNEALTVIDVNSGSFNKSGNSKEAILKTNFYAAIEIAYQLKVRNINGVVIIDFIDMSSQGDQLQLLEHFSKLLKVDNARPQIVQLSELGLVELTRRRREQSLKELFTNDRNSRINSTERQFVKLLKHTSKYYNSRSSNYKNMRYLFFKEQFKNKKYVILKKKSFKPSNIFTPHYFTYIDNINPIQLMRPKVNYIIPLQLYFKLVGNKLTVI